VNRDLIDFSDFFSTFAELAGADLPGAVKLDSHSFAPQIKGERGSPREWVYVELNGRSYVRDARYKLTNKGELFDLSEAPYKEILVEKETSESAAARKKLQAVLNDHPTAASTGPAGKAGKAAKRAAKRAAKKAAKETN
jgi:arylsulfatase A